MKLIRSFCFYGLLIAAPISVNTAWAVDPISFEVRNNADLVAVCSAQPNDPNYIAAIHFCHGFALGFNRYHEALKEGKDFVPVFCFPETVTRTQVINEYLLYSKAHPEYDKDALGDVITKFLVETYPCKAKTK